MARHAHRLSAAADSWETMPGLNADGGGLSLRITAGNKTGKRLTLPLVGCPTEGI